MAESTTQRLQSVSEVGIMVMDVMTLAMWKRVCTVKKTGEFFLHGEGGAMTEYSESYAGNTCGSERIIPLTEDEAKEWVENQLDADDYESIFGPVEE